MTPDDTTSAAQGTFGPAVARVEHALEAAQRGLARRIGTRALHVLRTTLKVAAVALLLVYFVFGALLLATRYWLMPRIDDVRPALERQISRTTGMHVSIGRIESGWRGFNPHLKLSDVHVRDARDRTALYFPQLDATVSWASVPAWRPQFKVLAVQAPELEVQRLPGGRLSVAGFVFDPATPDEDGNALGDWILEQERLEIRDARVRYIDATVAPAAAPLELEEVQIVLANGWGRHRFALNARPPSHLASRIDIRASFWHPWLERAADWRLWSGRAFAQMDYVDLAALNRLVPALPPTMRVERAQGALRTWLDFREQRERRPAESEAEVGADRVVRFVADLALADVHTRLGRGLDPLELTAVRGRVTHETWGTAREGGHELRLDNLDMLTVGGQQLPPTSLRLRTTDAAGDRAARGEFEANRLSIDLLAHLAQQVPLAAEVRQVIARHALRGDLLAPRATWEGELERLARYSLRTRFERLGAQGQPAEPEFSAAGNPRAGFPGVENLAGTIELNESGGSLQIGGRDAVLTFPGVFEQPRIPFDRLQADVRWQTQPPPVGAEGRRLEVRIDSFAASNTDLELAAAGTWHNGGRKVSPQAVGPGVVDLQGRIARLDVATAHRYIPRLVGPGARAWLRGALLAGQGSEGQLRVRGDLWEFPFVDPKSGDFRASVRVRDATVDYVPAAVTAPGAAESPAARARAPVWPSFSGVDAQVAFERNRMSITGTQANVFGLRLSKVNVGIADLGAATSTLTASTEFAGPVQDMLRYVTRSPVNDMLGGFLARSQASGNARAELKLEIPFSRMQDTKVAGSVHLQNNDVQLSPALAPFARASGRVDFSERGVTISNATAGFVGGQARFDAATAADGTIAITAQGSATPQGVRRTLDIAAVHRLLDRTQGTTRYNGTVTVRRGPAASALELQVESDLVGWNIDAPAPARKAAAEALPLRVEIVPDPAAAALRDRVVVTAGPVLAARLERVRVSPEADARIVRGVIAIGEPMDLPQDGLLLVANLARVDLDQWSSFLQSQAADNKPAETAARATPDAMPDFVSLRARELIFSGKPIANVVLGATRMQENGVDYWQANVVSDNASGALVWRPNDSSAAAGNAGRLSARFAHLAIPDAQNSQVFDVFDGPVKDMPAIDVVAESFEIAGRKLGRLELTAQNVGSGSTSGWELQRLALTSPEARMTAQGRWEREAGAGPTARRRMSMGFAVDFDNAGALLGRLGFADALRNGQGRLEGELAWRGSPFSIDYPSLSGRLTLVTDRGQFLRAEPGVARLLGVMSLQSLPRRVSLDFRDVFSEGFAFDSIRASADIKSGALTTRDFRMRGVTATVLIEGGLDLRNETQELHVLVLPEINAGSASLVYALLANPAIGLGTFVAQLFLRDPLSKAFSYEYDVSGSWSEPQVKRRASKTPAPSTTLP